MILKPADDTHGLEIQRADQHNIKQRHQKSQDPRLAEAQEREDREQGINYDKNHKQLKGQIDDFKNSFPHIYR